MANASEFPLCVDLDGTLLRTDLLAESLAAFIRTRPLRILSLPLWLARGRACLKRRLAESVSLDVVNLPYNAPVLERLRAEKAAGRRLVLATASDITLARQVAGHIGLFDDVIASDNGVNLIGERKERALVERFGRGGFDYAGDSYNDLPVWRASRRAILVDVPDALAARAGASETTERISSGGPGRLREAWRAMRPHQWGKNLIIFLPLVTAHRLFEISILKEAFLAAAAFSLCASSVYILNDIFDLQGDRVLPGKKQRPFAAGTLPLAWAPFLIAPLLAAAAALSAGLAHRLWLVLACYYALTFFYSIKLRSVMVLDVFCLAVLYTVRLFAGHAVSGIPFSPWLFGFSMFLFLSLAFMKRFVEFSSISGAPGHGRGYVASDADMLREMGVTSGYVAALIFALYIHSDQVARLYARPMLLWPSCFIILFAMSRMWFLAQRGGIGDDPVLFVLKDRTSYLCAVAIALILVAASMPIG